MDEKPLQSTRPAEVTHMISLEVLMLVALPAVCIFTATAVNYVTPREQGDPSLSGVALAALIVTSVATLLSLIMGPDPKPSVNALGVRGQAKASRPEEQSTIGSWDNTKEVYWTLRQQLAPR